MIWLGGGNETVMGIEEVRIQSQSGGALYLDCLWFKVYDIGWIVLKLCLLVFVEV